MFALRWLTSLRSGPLLNEGQDVVRACSARIRQLATGGGGNHLGLPVQNNNCWYALRDGIAIAIGYVEVVIPPPDIDPHDR